MKIVAWGLSSLVASVRAWDIQLGYRETGTLVPSWMGGDNDIGR